VTTSSPRAVSSAAESAAALFHEQDVGPRARLIAQAVAESQAGAGVMVYVLEEAGWVAKAAVGEARPDERPLPRDRGTLGMVAGRGQPLIFGEAALAGGGEAGLAREHYAHLDLRRALASLAYFPLIYEGKLIAAIEVASFDRPLREAWLAPLAAMAPYWTAALANALAHESERNAGLESINRLTQLYDIATVFSSTLEMDELLPIITSKIQELLNAQAVNLWMVESGDSLLLMNRAGEDATLKLGASQKSGEGIAAEVSNTGEPVVIASPDDERLQARNREAPDAGAIHSLIAVPLIAGEEVVGVIEAVNRREGGCFDEDSLLALSSVATNAADALHNASLLQAESKVEILETLVNVSSEISSTLDVERVLQAIVNSAQQVIPYERAAVAIDHFGRLELKAVSGSAHVKRSDPEIRRLSEMLEWASISEEELFVTQREEEISDERESARARFSRYFAESGMRGFYSLPLGDEQGRIGILSFESSDPDFLTEAHLAMIKVLAGQASVALRNAQLYREVPFVGILEPVLAKKRRLLGTQRRRRLAQAIALSAAALLAVVPMPLRLEGDAAVAPARSAQVEPEVEGVVRKVYVREGDAVRRGDVLADLEDWPYRTALAEAEAKYRTAQAGMNRALALNDAAEAGVQRVQSELWTAEVERARQRLERTRLRAVIDGIIATPRLENFVGRRLAPGETFAEIVDASVASVDIGIDERDASLLRAGESAAVKLDGYPTRIFRGAVTVVSPRAQVSNEERVYFARVSLPNPEKLARPGMQGRAKIRSGWRPAGYVIFRRPAMWIWSKLWNWFGW